MFVARNTVEVLDAGERNDEKKTISFCGHTAEAEKGGPFIRCI